MSNSSLPEPSTERVTRSSTARNPRRRPRQSDNDTLKTHAPRRKRSKVTEDTYVPRLSTENGSIAPSQESDILETPPDGMNDGMNGSANGVYSNGFHRHERAGSTSTPLMDGETSLAIRGSKKGTVKRSHLRGDGATTLCHNEVYTVKMLPSTPRELKKPEAEYRGSVQGNYALAVTQKKAIVWEYTSHTAASNPRTFDIPFPSRSGEPLPFGALVPTGVSTTDYGLLLISATSGKVIFYESIDRAASLGLFHDRKSGVEGTIPLSSYETVASLVPADHAGFIAVLSSGKLVHLTLRDAQGKPRIANQQLKITEAGSGGVFGSFTGFLKSTHRRDLTAVHTRPSRIRGRMQAIGLTERAEVLLWDLDWSGHSEFKASIDFREVLVNGLKDIVPPELHGQAEQAVALDFAISAKPTSSLALANNDDSDPPLFLLILARIGNVGMHSFSLVELSLPGEGLAEVERICRIETYSTPSSSDSKPRLVIPAPGHTAFVTFEDATTLMGTQTIVPNTPEAQLHASYVVPDAFEETIALRSGKSLTIREVYEEHSKGGQASMVSFIQGAGLVRITTADTTKLDQFTRISIKSKIEQAVFYGALQPDNIIDFAKQDESGYDLGDVQTSALAISDQILRADTIFTHFLPPSPPSMPHHLATKAKALQALATHVRTAHPAMSRDTMWRMLSDAERIAAGQQLWIAFQEHIELVSQVKRRSTLLDELCSWFDEAAEAFAQRKDLANEDSVRKFFIGGLHRLEALLQHVRVFLKDELEETARDPADSMKLVFQANEICLLSLQTAFKFRADNCSTYGIPPDLIEDGILIALEEYAGVQQFWTSPSWFVRNTVEIANLSGEINKKLYVPENLDVDTERLAREVADLNPKLLEIWCTQYQEDIYWHLEHSDPRYRETGKKLELEFEDDRYKQLRKLADVGQAAAGMQLAEKYRDMNTLTDMVIAEDQYLEEMMHDRKIDRSGIPVLKKELQSKIRQYFNRYGAEWSEVFFDRLFSDASCGSKLARAQIEWKQALTEYLRAKPSRAKLCWINDVTESHDFAHAATVLRQAAEEQETKLWSKKVELSMSKLALLAAEEAEGPTAIRRLSRGAQEKARTTQDDLTVVQVQEELYAHIRPDIMASIDREAELQICVQNYGNKVNEFPALRRLLELGLDLVLDNIALSVDQLIDILTLMDVNVNDTAEGNFRGSEFFQALRALNAAASSLPSTRFEMLLQTIWKRAYLYDNWNKMKLSSSNISDDERQSKLRQSNIWQTLRYFLESELNTEEAHVRFVWPSECLGSGCAEADWDHRFSDPEILDPLIADSRRQDDILQGYVTDRSLDAVVEGIVADVKVLLKEISEERKAMAEQATHLMEGDDHVNGDFHLNGELEGLRQENLEVGDESGVEEDEGEGEGEENGGDVEMMEVEE
ncbi:uncharacterized protein MYCFIDRAFT_214575 [Pseudocercospora fijiensis CIRAD86]|uniref:Nucleoporin Nup133/Nup155-like C-terminal domain-containing protein n=1 Tax=Pseudocercospora fijiensis (strain CIRAD86) TaxID=383855 RepID=M3B3P4_PSEFD|nr:uncharacterized protein MYCFIDRAFT_214575 [Pseudocercospora fijiensis CIRAD86]EME83992.1 hypothetical protein MYCFIDRAFT_214575 [Pseudocercospora fijiensis CIRAD86]